VTAAAVSETVAIPEPTVVATVVSEPAPIAADVDAIDRFLAGSPLAGMGSVFVAAAIEYGIDPRLMPAIALWESSLGRLGCVTETRNPFGLKPVDHSATCRTFANYGDAIWVATSPFGGYGVPTETGLCWWVAGPAGVCNYDYVRRVIATMEGIR